MITRWEMIKAVWGSLDELREACERAKADGWTHAEVQWIIDLFHPSTALVVVLLAFAVANVLWGAL